MMLETMTQHAFEQLLHNNSTMLLLEPGTIPMTLNMTLGQLQQQYPDYFLQTWTFWRYWNMGVLLIGALIGVLFARKDIRTKIYRGAFNLFWGDLK